MSEFTQFIDLASERLGGAVLLANDDFFAPKENLLKAARPVYVEGKYTEFGKWMDGWETRRRRTPGHDWCIIRLGVPGIIHGVVVDTAFFRGNYPEHCSLEACALEDADGLAALTGPNVPWTEILPKSPLKGDSQNLFAISDPHRYTHLRFNIFPDGGIARLHVRGEVLPDWQRVLAGGDVIDLAGMEHGGRIINASDVFFSAPHNLLMPGPGADMGDGWETRRRRGPGHDWVIIRLGIPGTLARAEVDTAFFKGNYPESCSLEACDVAGPGELASASWIEVLPRTQLRPDSNHVFRLPAAGPATYVRFSIYPDGGVSRLRLFGIPTREGRMVEGLRLLNSLPRPAAQAAFAVCCGSYAWTMAMIEARPFTQLSQLLETADKTWWALSPDDWLQAFQAHPRIGEKRSPAAHSAQAQRWSEQEQSAAAGAATAVMSELTGLNQRYEERFGYIFITCATGKTADAMLAELRRRLDNDPERELRTAAEEQRQITRLRLEKLLNL